MEDKAIGFLHFIENTDLIYDDFDLNIFLTDHFQNLLSFEENKEAFSKFIDKHYSYILKVE